MHVEWRMSYLNHELALTAFQFKKNTLSNRKVYYWQLRCVDVKRIEITRSSYTLQKKILDLIFIYFGQHLHITRLYTARQANVALGVTINQAGS